MQPLAAGCLDEGGKTLGGQSFAHVLRRLDQALPGDILARIEIHDDRVGPLPVGKGRAPGVDLERAGLDEAR